MKENNDIWIQLLKYFVITVVIGCIFWLCNPNTQIKSLVFVPIFVTLLIIIVAQLEYILKLKNKKIELVISPKIIAINETHGLVLAKYSELYIIGSYVSFYFNEGNFDIFIGDGFIDSIQDDGSNLQIKIANVKTDYVGKFNNLYKNNIKIRPFASYKSLDINNGDKYNG